MLTILAFNYSTTPYYVFITGRDLFDPGTQIGIEDSKKPERYLFQRKQSQCGG